MPKTAPLAAPAGAPNRKVDLVRTAYRLFSEKGVHRVPLDEIASAAGLSKGLVIYYFKTKENLVLETMRWALDTTAERVRQAMAKATTPHGKVLAMIDGIWSGAETNRRFYLLYLDLAGHAARVQHFTKLSATFHSVVNALYAEVIAQGVAEGAVAGDHRRAFLAVAAGGRLGTAPPLVPRHLQARRGRLPGPDARLPGGLRPSRGRSPCRCPTT
jgi:AcrR family transcriptional regulator